MLFYNYRMNNERPAIKNTVIFIRKEKWKMQSKCFHLLPSTDIPVIPRQNWNNFPNRPGNRIFNSILYCLLYGWTCSFIMLGSCCHINLESKALCFIVKNKKKNYPIILHKHHKYAIEHLLMPEHTHTL
jgi:hypothetical protein